MTPDWPFWGRDQELSRIRAFLHGDTRTGLLITGAAGVGKTRLLDEVCRRVDRAVWVVRRALASPAGVAIPLGAFAPLLPAVLGQVEHQWQLLREAAQAIVGSSSSRRVLLAVDDVHLLDDLSMTLVAQLIRGRSVSALMTCRDGEAPESIAALLREQAMLAITVGTLSESEVRGLVAASLAGPVEEDRW